MKNVHWEVSEVYQIEIYESIRRQENGVMTGVKDDVISKLEPHTHTHVDTVLVTRVTVAESRRNKDQFT